MQLTLPRSIRRLVRTVLTVAVAGALVGGPAMAEGRGHGRGGGWARDQGYGGGEFRGPPGRGGWRGGYDRDEAYGAPAGRGPRGYGYGPPPEAYPPYPGPPAYGRRAPPPDYGLRRGGRIPPEYRGAVVPDYRSHRLRPPPPGFAWVRIGGRYMLVSRATGQIFDVIGD